MDGDILTPAKPAEPAQRQTHAAPSRAKRVRWFVIVAVLVALVLGGLYGFNTFRDKAIANFFANNKPPPAQIAAVKAASAAVPHFANGIGSLAAVHQVTVTPEVGDLANYQAQKRMATLSLQRAQTLASRQYASQESVDQAQTQLDQANAQIQKTQAIIAQKQIRAPFAGRLGVRQVELGQYVNPGAALVSLTDLSMLYVNFTLPSNLRSAIALGQTVDVTTDAFPGRSFTAKLTTIEPQIRADTRTITVQATMANPDEALLPGMFVDAKVVLPAEADQVVLPETAVDYTLYGDSVYVVRTDGTDGTGKPVLKAFRTPVKTGQRWDGKVEILSGLKPGDEVVAAGQLKVQNGAAVTVTGNPPPQPPTNPTQH
ncbi:MAG TPA: efflux RND transporter periplasmic adaptor subunit [Stellaceae bacterium]|nr:efflux RND transporter periplasmic adaptor subunit [Stellaceae bacterium]